jgi:gliding motility-associated-like protein
VWNFGTGSPTIASNPSTYVYSNSGIYNITHTVTDINGCKDVATNTINIYGFFPTLVSTSSLCLGSLTTLTASGGTGYSWSPASSLNNSLIATPIANPIISTIYTVLITNNSFPSTCTKTLSTSITVLPKPTADFSLSAISCTNLVNTTNLSPVNVNTHQFSWNFGNGSPPNSFFSPSVFYPNNGTYTLSLTVFAPNGCTDTKTVSISIFNFLPGLVSTASVCVGNSANLIASGGTSYTWSPSIGLSNTSIANPVANPSISTIYTVEILNTTNNANCSKSFTTNLEVYPSPISNFNFSINPCGGNASFFDNSQVEITDWFWNLSPSITSSLQSPSYFYKVGGTYTISLTTSNKYNCKNKIDKIISVLTPPSLSVNNETIICLGNKTQLNATGGLSYQWFPTQSLDNSTIFNPYANPESDTFYSVVITTSNTINGSACQFSLNTLVKVSQLSLIPISVNANPTVIITGNGTTLNYIGSPGALVTWYPLNSTNPATGYSVTAFPDKPTTYTAIATNGACAERLQVRVDAYENGCIEKDLFIPNTFTPNNDGQNDVLYVRGLKVDEITFSIYNRWGELVFETKDKTKGWEGNYKGKPAELGVYGWMVTAKCITGVSTFKKGNITLIR